MLLDACSPRGDEARPCLMHTSAASACAMFRKAGPGEDFYCRGGLRSDLCAVQQCPVDFLGVSVDESHKTTASRVGGMAVSSSPEPSCSSPDARCEALALASRQHSLCAAVMHVWCALTCTCSPLAARPSWPTCVYPSTPYL